ncbi:MAG TPA: hypothetical protein VJ828_00605 [Lacipirellulaceae bacterium]|nr:hypothetical protein [Lacipirellulaceae bacterium]
MIAGIILITGCDMGLKESSNRYEQLNIEGKKLLDVLKTITDEASANANQSALEESGDNLRDIQERILASEEKKAKEGGGGMGRITNYRQAGLWEQTGDAARRQVERIRKEDAKAGAIVDKALEGVVFPEPAMETMPQ